MRSDTGRAIALAWAVMLAGAPVLGADGDIYIGNQAAGKDYILRLEEACPAGECVGLTFQESLVPEKKHTLVQLRDPSDRQTIKSGELAVLSWSPQAGAGPRFKRLRLEEAGGGDAYRIVYRVKWVGEVEAVPLAGPGIDTKGAFDKLGPDILAFWGR